MRHRRGQLILLWMIFIVYYVSGWICSNDDDCAYNVERCISGVCHNACVNLTCEKNQRCNLINLKPVCITYPHFNNGNFTPEHVDLPLVDNTKNFTPEYVSLPLGNTGNFTPEHFLGLPLVISVGPDCTGHDHCPSHQACIKWKCLDPCLDACGENTVCQCKHHIAACTCKPGFSGNPFEGCKRDNGVGSDRSFPQFSGKTKKFHVESAFRVNWSTGFYNCLEVGRRLATIQSKIENDLAKKEIKKTKVRNARFWTAGTNLAFGTWTWVTTGQPFGEFSDWNPMEPNNDEGACMQFEERFFNGYGWTDQGCYGDNYHICEYYE